LSPVRPTAVRPVALAAALLLSACTVSGDGATAGGDAAAAGPEPTGEVSVAPDLVPLAQVPRDTREVSTPVFELLAPAAFTESQRPGPGGIPMVVLSGDTGSPGAVVEVVAFSDPEPDAPVQEQMAGLVVSLVDVRRARDVSRQQVDWPGTSVAVVVRWTEDTAVAGGGSVTQTFTQLAVETEDGRSATVIAVAPEEEFETSGALDVLRSFSVVQG
jgi:hypothetical protein